jgi:hypothetical protein
MSKNQENVLREEERRAPYGEGMKCSLNVWQTKSYLYYTRIAVECVHLSEGAEDLETGVARDFFDFFEVRSEGWFVL